MKPLPGRTGSSIYTGVPCPYLDNNDDIDMPTRGTKATLNEILYWMEQDFPGIYLCSLIEEAFAFWTQDANPDEMSESEASRDKIIEGLIYAVNTGFALVVYYDEATELTEKPREGVPMIKFDVFPPYFQPTNATSTGYGVWNWSLNKKNQPDTYQIYYGAADGKPLEVDASRCTPIIFNKKSVDWRGLGLLVGCKDDIRDYWKWRRVLGERASTRAVTRLILNKQQGTWTDAEKSSVENGFSDVKYATVVGVNVNPVGGDLSDNEINATLNALLASIAVTIGVSLADMQGAIAEAAGEKAISRNSNKKQTTLRKFQNWGRPYIEQIYTIMGWTFTGLNPPYEIPLDVQDSNALKISDAFVQCNDKDMKEVMKGRFMAIYKGVKKQKLNEIEPRQQQNEFGAQGGQNLGGPVGGNGNVDGESPADRARDRDASNRNRKENDRPAR